MSCFKRFFFNRVSMPGTLCICYFVDTNRNSVINKDFNLHHSISTRENRRLQSHQDSFNHRWKSGDKFSISNYKLISVNVFFRHGARTPLSHLPGVEEVLYDKTKWCEIPPHTDIPVKVETPDGQPRPDSRIEQRYKMVNFKGGMYAGNLTVIGREQAYDLGKKLHQRYVKDKKFISSVYNKEEVFIRSTNVDRCIQSLQCVMAGMFGRQCFKEPLVITVATRNSEILFPNFRYCDTLRTLEHKSKKYLDEQNGIKFLSHYINYFTNQKEDTHVGMMQWRDHLAARQAHGLEIPLWLEAIQDHVNHWATKSLEVYSCGVPQDKALVLSLIAGPMLHLVRKNFTQAIEEDKSTKKLNLYSCHDSSLLPLMCALGIFDHKWPPFCADVTLELYSDQNGDYFVKISYLSEDITLPGFDTPMIPYDKFKELIEPYEVTPTQYSLRCHDMDLAKEHAAKWEAIIKSQQQEEEEDEEDEEVPPNM